MVELELEGIEYRSLGACVVDFRRSENSAWERGIAVLEDPASSDVHVILDYAGKAVEELFTFSLAQHAGCFSTMIAVRH
jgi:hypothetical protein